MMLLKIGLAAPIALSAALITSCGGQAKLLTVTAQSFQFAPKTIEVPAGPPVKLTLRNPDTIEHDFQVDHFPMKMTPSEMKHMHEEMAGMPGMDSAGGMDMLHLHSLPGESHSITFTPTKPGTYAVYCSVPGHKDAGMTATLVVR